MADYFSRNPGLDKGEDTLGRYSVMGPDDKIIKEKLKKLVSLEPKIMIRRILMKEYRADRLVSKYEWRYLTIMK